MIALLQADAAHIPLDDESVHCVITSPPYWSLRNYGLPPLVWGGDVECEHVWEDNPYARRSSDGGKEGRKQTTNKGANRRDVSVVNSFCVYCNAWRGSLGLEPTLGLYVEHIVAVFREVKRVLRSDGTLWLNLGDSYASGKGTCYNPGGGANSLGQTRKQAGAYPLDRGSVEALRRDGLKPKDLCGIPWRVAFALQADGWYLRSDIIWAKKNPMPESVTDRLSKAHEYIFLLTKNKTYYYDQEAIREPQTGGTHSRGMGNGGPKARIAEGTNTRGKQSWAESTRAVTVPGGRNRRTVWTIATHGYSGAHFATFPEKLVEPCVLAGTSAKGCCPECGAPWERVVEEGLKAHDGDTGSAYPEGTAANRLALLRQAARERGGEYVNQSRTLGWHPMCDHEADPVPCLVLDPFCGTGTVGTVCMRHNRSFIGIDLSWPYLHDLATERLSKPVNIRMDGI